MKLAEKKGVVNLIIRLESFLEKFKNEFLGKRQNALR